MIVYFFAVFCRKFFLCRIVFWRSMKWQFFVFLCLSLIIKLIIIADAKYTLNGDGLQLK